MLVVTVSVGFAGTVTGDWLMPQVGMFVCTGVTTQERVTDPLKPLSGCTLRVEIAETPGSTEGGLKADAVRTKSPEAAHNCGDRTKEIASSSNKRTRPCLKFLIGIRNNLN